MEREPVDAAPSDELGPDIDPELRRELEADAGAGARWLEALRRANGVDLEPKAPAEGLTQASVTDALVGDAATPVDALGFEPYVKALATFLSSAKTRPPLTVSLEGDWGSGKSSFMLQLRERIRGETGPASFFIEFNAWRYEKEEALWAAFALNFVRAMRRQVGPLAGLRANLKLAVDRLDREQGLRLVRTVIAAVLFIVLSLAAFLQAMHWLHLEPYEPGWWGSAVGLVGVAGIALKETWDRTAFAFERDLTKFFDAPDYRGNRAFVETFSDDFAKIVRAYISPGQRAFVFIDDLDRCEVSRAANLLQALNIMLAAGEGAQTTSAKGARDQRPLPIVYVLGLDRRLVCAAVAATFEKHLPYLDGVAATPFESAEAARELACEYLDKFVQVPFRMPVPTAQAVKRYVAKITGLPETDAALSNVPPAWMPPLDSLQIESGIESEPVRNVVEMVAPLFANNPRRVKQFLNVFRLQAHIAGQTALFGPRATAAQTLTLPKLAKVTAIFLRYPLLAGRLQERPELLGKLQQAALAPDSDSVSKSDDPLIKLLVARPALVRLLAYNGRDDAYRLDELDVRHLLVTVPAQPRRGMSRAQMKSFEASLSPEFLELLES